MRLKGAEVAVVGLGRSGVSACRFCAARGAAVAGCDEKSREQLGELANELEALGVRLSLGESWLSRLGEADLVVVSPGVPDKEELRAVEAAGVPAVSEVELASWYLEGMLVGITGTNGKSTVTALVGAMLEAEGRPTFVGGNFGTPLVEAVGTEVGGPGGALVVELSSFQLERVSRLRPDVAVLLNVTDDHLDRYPSLAAYAAAKARLLVAQREEDHVVAFARDPLVLAAARGGAGQVHTFGGADSEVRLDGDAIVDFGAAGGPVRYPRSLLRITGAHNVDNAAAAILAARLAGAGPKAIRTALAEFAGLPHRMQHVGSGGDVSFYDDSKATNVGAAVAALEGIDGKAVLIAGGRDKGGDYGPLRRMLERKGRAVVLIGEASDIIEGALGGVVPLARASTMVEAVELAAEAAAEGDAVLLAPACSSFDMYANYAERGEDFARAVRDLLRDK